MATFRFKSLDPTRKPLLVDEAEDKIPRIKELTTPALSPTLQRLLTAAAEAELAMLTRTLIYKTDIAKALIAAAGDQVSKSTRQWRESCEGTFFTVQQDGNQVLAVSCQTGQTRDYGGFRTDIYRSLEKKNQFPEDMAAKHVRDSIALIDPKKHDLVLETGAGLDQTRIETLAMLAAEREAHFACHDVIPSVMREGQTRMPNIPYIALPPFPAFLGQALNSVSARKVITMKNTLTSIDSDEIDDWLDVIAMGNIDRIVITQSIGPNPEVFVRGSTEGIEKTCEILAIKTAKEHTVDEYSFMIIAMIVRERVKQIAYTAILEILMQNLADRAKKKGFSISKKTVTNAMAEINNIKEIEAFLASKGIAYMTDFQQGAFNEITFTPTAILYEKLADIPPNTLRIRSQQIHIVLERNDARTTAINACSRTKIGIPIPAFAALKKWIPGIKIDELKFDPLVEEKIGSEATYAGLAIAFDYLGDVVGLQEVKQYRLTPFERDMYTSFGVTVDS